MVDLDLAGYSLFGSWYATGAKPISIVLDLATSGMLVSFGRFGNMCDSCELLALGYSG
jgi:hypothetical protein